MKLLWRFEKALDSPNKRLLEDVDDFAQWMVGRLNTAFVPTDDDDVDLRAYLFHLRLNGARPKTLRRKVASLRCFYDWLVEVEFIEENPLSSQTFDRPLLSRAEVRRRQERLPLDPDQRRIAHLEALNQLSQDLNRSADVRSALDTALEALVSVMGLKTAWVFTLPEIDQRSVALTRGLPHDFALVAGCGLPPGLRQDDYRYLCQPPDCHCQGLARRGRLTRAVNVVECSRLQDSARADGDNRGLYFHASTPLIVSGRMLGIVNVATEEWQFFTAADLQFLSLVGAQVAVALERAQLYDLTRQQRRRLEQELEMAREVQSSLLPDRLPAISGFELAASWQSAREVAGDFYDVFPLAGGTWGLVVADVSDKGAPAALYMAMVRSLTRASATQNAGPAQTLLQVNASIHEHSLSDMFVTIFYGVLDPLAGRFCFASAGHDPPLLRRDEGMIERLMPTGPLLGVFETMRLDERSIDLAPGDVLLIYTDGITDALNGHQQEYGRTRLVDSLARAPATARSCVDFVLSDLADYIGDAPQPDDITLLALSAAGMT